MAKYSELPDGGGTIAGSDQIALNQSGTSRRATVDQLNAAINVSRGIWSADKLPVSPNALDYEGGSVAAWTDWDFGARMQAPVNANGHMVLEYLGAAGDTTWAGAHRAVPVSGEYTIVAKILGITSYSPFQRVGLALFEDATATGDMLLVQHVANIGAHLSTMTAYNAGEATLSGPLVGIAPTYYRLRVNGTAVVAGVSNDGVSWFEFGSVTASFTPAYFGPIIASTVTETLYSKMRFCRVFDGVSGRDSVTLGGV